VTNPIGIDIDSNNVLYVATSLSNNLVTFNTVTGASINPGLIIQAGLIYNVYINNNTLYIAYGGNSGVIGKYTLSGTRINEFTLSYLSSPNLNYPYGMYVDNNTNILYVASNVTKTVGKYNATTGAIIDPGFINASYTVQGIAVDSANDYIYLGLMNGIISQYTLSTGLVSNINYATGVGTIYSLIFKDNYLYATNPIVYRITTQRQPAVSRTYVADFIPLLNKSDTSILNNQALPQQNGIYFVTSSSADYGATFANYQAFAYSYPSNANYWATNSHGTTTLVNNSTITGEWLQIQLPISFQMTSFSMYAVMQSPPAMVVAGSIDGIIWENITTISNTKLPDTNIPSGWNNSIKRAFRTNTNKNYYMYFRFIVVSASTRQTNIGRLNINGLYYVEPVPEIMNCLNKNDECITNPWFSASSAGNKKWFGNRDASAVTRNRRVQSIGSGSLHTTGIPDNSLMQKPDNNTIRNALKKVRSGGATTPAKVSHKYTNAPIFY